ncbi:hypothetical protein CI102_13343, partial [Trichoderma harzianum]
MQLFLEKGANMNAHCGRWHSAVHAAVSGEHMNILELFVSKGADVNSQPPLFVCISIWNTQCLKYLLDHGMNIDTQDIQHGTALHKAIADGHSAHFDLLLERGADINALSEKLGSPLQAACVGPDEFSGTREQMFPKIQYIEKLLELGADPNICGGK